jgi:hypothetical protein
MGGLSAIKLWPPTSPARKLERQGYGNSVLHDLAMPTQQVELLCNLVA